jgi:opacity protein-like surface antigen
MFNEGLSIILYEKNKNPLKAMSFKSILVLVSIFFFACSSSSHADDSRSEIPEILQHSYLGLQGGYGNYHYEDYDLATGLQVDSSQDRHYVYRIYAGRYFNPYLALEMSLMRPYYVLGFHRLPVRMSLFGLTVKPTLPLSDHFSIYGKLGPGYISRRGFRQKGIDIVKDDTILTVFTGGGLSYKLNNHWFFDINATYTLADHDKNQPPIFSVAAGGHYLMFSDKRSSQAGADNKSASVFPHHTVLIGGFNSRWLHWEVPDDFPIFWSGDVKLKNGVTLTYQRNFFHTDKAFSLDWGLNLSRWKSDKFSEVFYGISLFPAVKFWFIRSNQIDFYVTFGIAGPTYLSQRIIDDIDTGEHFTFYDFMGLGAFIGKNKNLHVTVQVAHYSNGGLFPQNPGIRIPMTTNIGYAF